MSTIEGAPAAPAGTLPTERKPSGRPAPFRKRFVGSGGRPGFLTYGLLLAFLVSSAYPL
jgi:cellobiose transport system permease protein